MPALPMEVWAKDNSERQIKIIHFLLTYLIIIEIILIQTGQH
jgi:hypothetical protein